MPEPQIDAALFEGMFIRAFQPSDAIRTELKGIGVDVQKLTGKYPLTAWRQSIHIARKHLYPELSADQGCRELGLLFIDGYFQTIIGKVLSIPLAFLSPEKIIDRLPKTFQAGRSDIKLDPPKQEGPKCWRITFHDSDPIPEFVAGVDLGGAHRTADGKNARVEIENASDGRYDVVVSW